jgi:hypothetical protein
MSLKCDEHENQKKNLAQSKIDLEHEKRSKNAELQAKINQLLITIKLQKGNI